MEGFGSNRMILLVLCIVFSLLLIIPLIWMCFLNLTYRLGAYQKTKAMKARFGDVEQGLQSLEEEVKKLTRKLCWLEGSIAVRDCEQTEQVNSSSRNLGLDITFLSRNFHRATRTPREPWRQLSRT